ncbi:hypothetical protein OS493_000437 [Desmophyllum pertusum]|uniref:Uncharacterized protein n=1 Tax=Desmophyllum pertusum TaxID=174260 RepID=A0A9X0DE36_9CNID|nr:hypothetical protein OS493_000437 [Desmophyllum pertusum]
MAGRSERSASGSSSSLPATPDPHSSMEKLVSGLLENPHFQDVLERTTRRTATSSQSPRIEASQPATTTCCRCLWKNFGRFLGPEHHHRRARILLYLDLGVSISVQEDVPLWQAGGQDRIAYNNICSCVCKT